MKRDHISLGERQEAMSQCQRIRRAVRLFYSDLVPKEIRRANVRKWLAATEQLGDRWVYRGGQAKWGINLKVAK
jgi:hypothetical protein